MNTPTDQRDQTDPGDEVLRRFRYQFAYGVILLVGAATQRLDYQSIWCEQHEDLLAERPNGSFDAYQIKTRKPELGSWELNDEALWRAIARFVGLYSAYPTKLRCFKFVSNAEYSDSAASGREHLSPLKLLVQASALRHHDELTGPAKKAFELLMDKIQAPPNDLFEVLRRLELIKGPTLSAFEDELAQSHVPKLSGCSGLSAHALAHLGDVLIATVGKASSLVTSDPSRHWLALNRDPQGDAWLLAKRIAVDHVNLIVSATCGTSFTEGPRFEDEVAALYRLMGYQVDQKIQIYQEEVDILASYRLPGTWREHRIIVWCKDEVDITDQNQHVMQFQALLGMARGMGQADSAEIVTRKRWSHQAKGVARQAGIALYTFEEKLRDIIDFSHYIERVIYDFEHFEEFVTPRGRPLRRPIIDLMSSSDLHRTYVPLVCHFTDDHGESREMGLDEYLDKWLADPDPDHNYLSILGDFGTGKSSFCLHLTYELAKRYQQDPVNGRIPLFISLRDYAKAVNLQQLITDLLLNKYHIRFESYAVFERFLEQGHLIFIFDGFDEMTTKTDRTDTIRNFEELTKAAVAGSKTILTCRTHYFKDQRHVRDTFGNCEGSQLLLAVRERRPAFQMVELEEFSDDQIKTLLSRQRSDDWEEVWVAIQRNLQDLARRPLLLDMIIRSPGDLDRDANIARLYDVFTQLWIKREDFHAKMTIPGKQAFMQDLAMEMWLGGGQSIHYGDLEGRIQKYFKDQIGTRGDLDRFDHDTRTCSFLNRDLQGNYRFIHKSFMEFFVAKEIAEALGTNTIDPSFRERKLSPEISSFVAQLVAAKPDALATLCAWTFDETFTLSWNAINIVSFLKAFDPEPVVEQLVRLSNNKRPRSGINFVLGELGVASEGVLALLHCSLNDTSHPSSWWESAFALEKVEGMNDPVGALIERLAPEWTFAKALEHFREIVEAEPESESVTSSDLPDGPPEMERGRISVDQRAVVAIVREYRKGGGSKSSVWETVAELFRSLDLSCDTTDRRAYYAIWLLGELRVSSALPTLLRAVNHPQAPVRNMLAEAIGKIGVVPGDTGSIDLDRECLNALKRLLVDNYYRVRFHAAQSVRKIRAVALLTDLKQALECEPMRDIQDEMLKTVRVLEG